MQAEIKDKAYKLLRRGLFGISLVGFICFSAIFALTFVSQDSIERAGKEFIKHTVQKELSAQKGAFAETQYGDTLLGLKDRFVRDESRVKLMIDAKLDGYIAEAVAQFCKLDCNAKAGIQTSIREGLDAKLSRVGLSLSTVEDLIANKYDKILKALKRDVRIFLGTNSLVFFLIGLILLSKKRAARHLVVPTALLTLSTVLCSFLYLFEQNWFFTILYGSYWGFAYTAYVIIIFLFLLDIVFNKGRVTAKIFEMIGSVVGNGISIGLC